jgi:hypothetical protein
VTISAPRVLVVSVVSVASVVIVFLLVWGVLSA